MIWMLPIAAAFVAAGVTAGTNWLALISWRRRRTAHWAEQARALHPIRVGARTALFAVPVNLALAVLLLAPETSVAWIFATAAIAFVGALAGTIPFDRKVLPRISVRALIRQAVIGRLVGSAFWFALFGAAMVMPLVFDWRALAVGAAFLGFLWFWQIAGWIVVGRLAGWLTLPSPRLLQIVAVTSARTGVAAKEVWVMRVDIAQALALPLAGKLVFTERLLAIMSDDEIAAVCAHELGHLSESRGIRLVRALRALVFLPWVFVGPLFHEFGTGGIAFAVLLSLGTRLGFGAVSRRLEARADRVAKSHESVSGIYAQALLRLYQDNLLPAVSTTRGATHPHLYDRLLAAGCTPDFPRPDPPATFSWNGLLFSVLLVLQALLVIMSQVDNRF